jgi:NADP-dependent 3-hydroxy acid dehydrogenase YdfG
MEQRRVLITGAGSGLGRALAFCFAENGWRVACADINIDAANDTVRQLTEFGVGAMALWVDVGDDASVEEMRDEVLAAWDGVDIVVNNAGVASAGSIAETSLDDWRWTLNINLMGVVRCCRAFLPAMLRQARGQFINIASFAGVANAPHMGAYSASKAAVISLSETLRAELS